jgi:hypothetical protein
MKGVCKMTVASLVQSREHKIAEVVFSKSKFKKEDVQKELDRKGISLTIDELSDILENYRDDGLIAKVGTAYALNL